MEAVYESERINRPVALKRYDTLDTFRGASATQEA